MGVVAMQLHKNLKQARLRIGQSQIKVSKNIGISNAALSNYETGYREPDVDTLYQLAKYYNVSLDDLIGITTDGDLPPCDLYAVVKSKHIAFKGDVYVLKESQKQLLMKELEVIFSKFDRCKVK
ncbi:helix-turn-helix domain-containing protein [Veillonella montpellierensis]|uniref:helix-turn-helix domain-containing protein n=1 Tax=Veillonella montpellierensis TaxID=187328 RepID=UPI0023F9835C|nr:helix-turn-helix domain-containing protein [Veillonella montpellierensis]